MKTAATTLIAAQGGPHDDADGGPGIVLTGPLSPAAVLLLGARMAAASDAETLVPDGILIDREGHLHLQEGHLDERFIAPEYRGASTMPATTPPTAAVWALGRHLLELSLGKVVDDAVLDGILDDPARLAAVADVEGRPLAPRLCDVLQALLAKNPEERLQGLLPVTRVCVAVGKTFGDGDTALRAAVARQIKAPLKTTKDLPARAILGTEDVARLKGAGRPKMVTARTVLIPEMKDLAPRLQQAPAADHNEARALRSTVADATLQSIGLPPPRPALPASTSPHTVVDVDLQSLGFPQAPAGMAPPMEPDAAHPHLVTADLEAPAPVPVGRGRRVVVAVVVGLAVVVALVAVAVLR